MQLVKKDVVVQLEKLTQAQRYELNRGRCPYCDATIKSWIVNIGPLADVWRDELVGKGIDPNTGHTLSCAHKELSI